jgi:hypothetical protein
MAALLTGAMILAIYMRRGRAWHKTTHRRRHSIPKPAMEALQTGASIWGIYTSSRGASRRTTRKL